MTKEPNAQQPSVSFNAECVRTLGITRGEAFGCALRTGRRFGAEFAAKVVARPGDFVSHHDRDIARLSWLLTEGERQAARRAALALAPLPLPYAVFGRDLIEPGAFAQIDVAARLPISRAAALMPDAHQGYGLPIGGVLATEGAVIPNGVGVDIGCSMMLSILPMQVGELGVDDARRLLQRHTRFGAGQAFDEGDRASHPVLDEATWHSQLILRTLHSKAATQIGTSGSGNHFVDLGELELPAGFGGFPAGRYLAILSHSGSRGFGAQVGAHFTKLAEAACESIDPAALKVAWLSMDSEEGQAYWEAMNLAGRYALANHDVIHARLRRALGFSDGDVVMVKNSHNLAWKQQVGGRELIVHRKGATPAAEGQLGIIPGSMTAPGFLVRGKGEASSLESASHGSGRQHGRKAMERLYATPEARYEISRRIAEAGVVKFGGGIDEAPEAYKDSREVISRQSELVEVLGEFRPRFVMMDTDGIDTGPVDPSEGE